MLARLILELGPWSWLVLGMILLALEILVPGFFLIWIGIAALLTGALSLQLWEAAFWTWHLQVLVFLALSLASAFVGRRILSGRGGDTDQPLLNRRAEQLIGRQVTLTEPIVDGRGRLRIDDTVWRASGPDLPAGTKVRIVAARDAGLELVVERSS